VRFDQESRQSMESLEQIMVEIPTGHQIPISEIADIGIKRGPAQISRDNTRRRIVIGVNVRNRDVESLVEEVQQIIDTSINLPDGYHITYGGQFENLQNARQRLMVVVPIALALIFLLLYFAFRSITQAIIIYSAIPLSAIGGVFLLWIRDMPFSISAGVGFIALFGIATVNGIVLISYFNELKEKGVSDIKKRIVEGARARLRPVILTASAATLGFFPMALSASAGAEVQRPLATVVIGGLASSTILTLLVLPVIYMVVYGGKSKNGLSTYGVKMVLVFLSLALVPFTSEAQDSSITLDRAIELAKTNNLELRNAALNIENQKALVKTAWSLGETEVSYTGGQTNSELIDYNWEIKQDFGAPFHQSSVSNFMKLIVDQSEAEQQLVGRKIELETSLAYFGLAWRQHRYQLIQKDFLQYETATKIADLKYQSGESNLLSKVMMEAKYEDLRLMLQQAGADKIAAQQNLMKVLQSEVLYEAGLDSLSKVEVDFNLDSLFGYYEKSAMMNYLNKGLIVSEQ
ncbi:MAG: efflux RND transporter permease subunit, partial [Cyclobacteriaceae bacterium]|nr:efflux RND transporter permease subunit [Cyclobacteriaceae bacterium]